jgi:hypothetical protein
LSEGGVNESSSLVESDSVSTNDTLVFELNTISALFVDFIADDYVALIDKANFIEFIKLINKNGMLSVLSRF